MGFIGGPVLFTFTYTTLDPFGNPKRQTCQQQWSMEGCVGPQARMASPGKSTDGPIVLSDGKMEGAALVLVPNPATTQTRIDYKLAEESKGGALEVYDLIGRRVASQVLTNKVGNWTVDLAELPAGTYLVILKQSSGETLQQKRVVTH